MSHVITQRMTARIEGDFVVFLIGMRINRTASGSRARCSRRRAE